MILTGKGWARSQVRISSWFNGHIVIELYTILCYILTSTHTHTHTCMHVYTCTYTHMQIMQMKLSHSTLLRSGMLTSLTPT